MELSSVGFNYVPKRNVVVIEGIKSPAACISCRHASGPRASEP